MMNVYLFIEHRRLYIMWKKLVLDGIETIYSISDTGEVRNDNRNTILTQNTEQGYKTVGIRVNKKPKKCRVHRLVAITYIPNPENKPYVNHIDGNRSNNHVENLEWVTPQENTIHAVQTGLMLPTRKRSVKQYSEQGEFIAEYESITQAAKATNTSGEKITSCCKGERITTNGFQWKYSEDNVEVNPVKANPQRAVPVAQIDPNTLEVIAIYPTLHAAAEAVNGTQSAITHVLKGDKGTKTHKGYFWKRVEEIVQ